jgi:hypothetical protein
MTEEQLTRFKRWYDLQRQSTNNQCDICGNKTILVYDHDHITNEFRGFLCIPCNSRLGQDRWQCFPLRLRHQAKAYLKNYSRRAQDRKKRQPIQLSLVE